jgi:hypothetical protein
MYNVYVDRGEWAMQLMSNIHLPIIHDTKLTHMSQTNPPLVSSLYAQDQERHPAADHVESVSRSARQRLSTRLELLLNHRNYEIT